MNVVVLTPEQLSDMITRAVAQGVEEGLMKAKPMLQAEEMVGEVEAMKLAGYSDRQSFRDWRKAKGIVPEQKARRNYYHPGDIRRAAQSKNKYT